MVGGGSSRTGVLADRAAQWRRSSGDAWRWPLPLVVECLEGSGGLLVGVEGGAGPSYHAGRFGGGAPLSSSTLGNVEFFSDHCGVDRGPAEPGAALPRRSDPGIDSLGDELA